MKVICPTCGTVASYEGNIYRPFCSRECKNKDLIRWADENYKISSTEDDDLFNEIDNNENPFKIKP